MSAVMVSGALAGATTAAPVTAAAPITVTGAAPAGAAFCGIHWGTKPKSAGKMVRTPVQHVRAGEHACFDRLVIDLGKGPKAGYRVEYVAKIIQDPSGRVIPVRGGAKLRITILAPIARGFPIGSRHLVDVSGFRTFRQVVGAGSFEGITSIGLGVRAKLPFRVFTTSSPDGHSHVVIDVAHRW